MALGRTVSSAAPHSMLARAWDGSGVSSRMGAGSQVAPGLERLAGWPGHLTQGKEQHSRPSCL